MADAMETGKLGALSSIRTVLYSIQYLYLASAMPLNAIEMCIEQPNSTGLELLHLFIS